jgi:hypothetical protein
MSAVAPESEFCARYWFVEKLTTLLPSGTPTPLTYATAPTKRTYDLLPMMAPFGGAREVAVEERPAVGFARDRNEVNTLKIEEIRDRRAAHRAAGIVQRHVSRDHKTVELEVHRERIAGYGEAVARPQAHVAVGFEQETIVVEIDRFRLQIENRRRRALRARRSACEN